MTVQKLIGLFVLKINQNHVLMCRRSDMAVEIGFKKWNKWAATDSPHALFFGLLKSDPGLCELDQIVHVLCASNC